MTHRFYKGLVSIAPVKSKKKDLCGGLYQNRAPTPNYVVAQKFQIRGASNL